MARPSFFTPELAEAICDRIAIGRSIRSVCDDEDMPSRDTVRRWMRDQDPFREQVRQAFAERTDEMREDMLAIADDSTLTPEDRKVRIATRQWIMARMAPKKYGDRLEVSGDPDRPMVSPDPNDMARRVAFMLATGAAQNDRPKRSQD